MIGPIRYIASYQLAADQIRHAIELGTLLPGDRLPPSRELAGQLGISVATLREALRGLLDEGLIEMRRGPKGGVVVLSRRPRVFAKREPAAWRTQVEGILDLREAVECHTARLAALRRTDADLERIAEALAEMDEVVSRPGGDDWIARVKRADARFHRAVAAATGNELLASAIEDAQARMFAALGEALRELAPQANLHHDAILRAIRRARPEQAARAMTAHIQVTRDVVRALAP